MTIDSDSTTTLAPSVANINGCMEALEAQDIPGALACFTEDVFYSHHAYPSEGPGAPRHEVRGREELRNLFENVRGNKAPLIRSLDYWMISGNHGFLRGHVQLADGSLKGWITEFAFDADNKISYSAVYAASPAVSRFPLADGSLG